jgi:glycosyltransferase involved in cell wall biosynthesis
LAWKIILDFHSILTSKPRHKFDSPFVFYGGALGGNLGGPLVKVRRLKHYFPEFLFNYNIAYLLSNTAYLSKGSLCRLRRNRIPIVLNQNGVFYPGWYAGDWKKQNLNMANAYHLADYVFWQSNFCRRSADIFLGPRDGLGEILYNAVDTNLFKPINKKNKGIFTFLVTGSISKNLSYRLETTISGLAMLRFSGIEARLKIAGWIEDASVIYAHAKRLGLIDHVEILGPYTQEEAVSIYQNADAYVITKYLDPCPNTVIEALACGLPVLYSASGGLPELVGTEAGIGLNVIEDWDAIHTPSDNTIAEGMFRIIKDYDVMSGAARALATSKYDIKYWIDRHKTVFTNLLRNK